MTVSGLVPKTTVILNSFQDPCAARTHKGDAHGSADRAWMLKQVQHDGRWPGAVQLDAGDPAEEAVTMSGLVPKTTVILNSFQDPGAIRTHKGDAHGSADRAWMLKQVQHDGRWPGAAQLDAGDPAEEAVTMSGLVPKTPVILNSFQDPCAASTHKGDAHGSSDRAWMLKQVQHDGRWPDAVQIDAGDPAEEALTLSGLIPKTTVILNSFQDPCAASTHKGDAHGSSDRAWMLKQVQHDGRWPGAAQLDAGDPAEEAVTMSGLVPKTTVILNSFQDPGAARTHKGDAHGSADRAWMPKQVQHDGRWPDAVQIDAGDPAEEALTMSGLVPKTTVILNSFQDPGAARTHKGDAHGSADRARMLKQVQHDEILSERSAYIVSGTSR